MSASASVLVSTVPVCPILIAVAKMLFMQFQKDDLWKMSGKKAEVATATFEITIHQMSGLS